MVKKQVIAMGGGGFSMEPDNPLLDEYVIGQARRKTPSVCFFPHATDDATRYTLNFYKAFAQLDAKPGFLSLFTPHTADFESYLMEQDVIYVGGGNTKSMIALWKEWELDRILRQAYDNGIVLAGISAGANCWFEQCSTDSWPGQLNVISCLGIIKGSFCPHYDGEAGRRPTLQRFVVEGRIRAGYAADDGAAAHFIDGEFAGGVSSRPNAKVYRVGSGSGGAIEEVVATRYLGV